MNLEALRADTPGVGHRVHHPRIEGGSHPGPDLLRGLEAGQPVEPQPGAQRHGPGTHVVVGSTMPQGERLGRAQLERHLLSCDECRQEREQLPALFDLLATSRVDPAPDFTDRVMSSLPPAGWEARHPRAWVAAAMVLVVLGALSAALAGIGAGTGQTAGPVTAIFDLFASAMTAGAGLPEKAGFAAQLSAYLTRQGVTARLVNAGVSGDTTSGGKARLGWVLADNPQVEADTDAHPADVADRVHLHQDPAPFLLRHHEVVGPLQGQVGHADPV